MVNIYHNIDDAAKRYGHEGDYVMGANIAAHGTLHSYGQPHTLSGGHVLLLLPLLTVMPAAWQLPHWRCPRTARG